MANRTAPAQEEHDTVVREFAGLFERARAQGFRIVTNPGASKNQGVGGTNPTTTLYPDVVVIEPTGTTVTAIGEVETSDSVTEAESRQWLDYARLGVQSFYVVAPRTKIAAAAAICARNGIKVTQFWQYEMAGSAVAFSQYAP